jgi:hypothetical protein
MQANKDQDVDATADSSVYYGTQGSLAEISRIEAVR